MEGRSKKIFRESLAQYRALSAQREKAESLTEEQLKYLAENERRYPNWEKQTALQKGLFDVLRLNEYITRLGQEPKNFQAQWTTPIAMMEKFGIKNIQAPVDYGSKKYVEAAYPNTGLRTKPLSLTMNAQGEIVEILE